MSLFSELKRRNIFKVAMAYLALGWVVVQITDVVVPALNLPVMLNAVVVYIGIIGFPFALFFTWAFELTPDGVRPTSEVVEGESIRASTGQKINYIIIGLMAIAITFLLFDRS
ncbi:MAG: adenylyl cyclase, partial [Kordiimonadaceae bacterium]|nr:adenylyl cyclase [Kordiimonadaceae bacterium]